MKNLTLILILSISILFGSCGSSNVQQATPSQAKAPIDPKGNTLVYAATVSSTNFTVPLVRFNLIENSEGDPDAIGNVNFFNSIGAGVSIGFGKIHETRNNADEIINSEFYNSFGIQAGFLFSARTGEVSENIFAPTLGLNLLNFQVGMGYELGTIPEDQKRTFITIAYAIPISRLIKGGFYVHRIDPVPIKDSKAFNF